MRSKVLWPLAWSSGTVRSTRPDPAVPVASRRYRSDARVTSAEVDDVEVRGAGQAVERARSIQPEIEPAGRVRMQPARSMDLPVASRRRITEPRASPLASSEPPSARAAAVKLVVAAGVFGSGR